MQKVVSPSMAQGAYANNSRSCVGAVPGPEFAYCPGWLSVFKNYTLQLDCVDFKGQHTNCWDIIDNIQIHAYARTAKEVLEKIEGYYDVFGEDFAGENGRTKKTLWLTEVAAGSSDGKFVTGFVEDLLSPSTGLKSRSSAVRAAVLLAVRRARPIIARTRTAACSRTTTPITISSLLQQPPCRWEQ